MDWLASITRKRCDSAFAKSRNACRVRRWKSSPADSMRSSSCCSRACDCIGSRSSRYVRFGNSAHVAHILKSRISPAVNSRPPAWYAREESRYRSVITTAPRSSAGRITSATCWARSAANSNASARGAISASEPSTPPSSSLRIATPSTVPPGSRVTTHSRPCASTYARNRSTCVVLPTPSMPSKEMNMPCISLNYATLATHYHCSLLHTVPRTVCSAAFATLSLLAATYSPPDCTSKVMNMPCIFITGRELRRDGRSLHWRQAIPHQPSPWSAWNRSPWRYGCWPNPYRPTRAPWHGDRHELDQQKP